MRKEVFQLENKHKQEEDKVEKFEPEPKKQSIVNFFSKKTEEPTKS